jgi:serine/threonine protein kinase
MLTMLDRRIGPTEQDLAACRSSVEEVTSLAKASSSKEDEWARIARVVDVRRAGDGRIVITTPLFEGLSVEDTLASGRLSVARVIAIVRQLCHALRPMHRVGLHHGALSTASVILVADKGRKDAIRVVDIGVGAIFTGPFGGDDRVDALPVTPEHGRNEELTPRSDIYRIGAVAHTMLTGKPLFSGDSGEAIMRAHLEQPPDALTGAAASLAAIVSRCLSKDPSARFESVDALELAVCQAQADASISTVWDDLARPPGAPPAPEKTSILAGKGTPLAKKPLVPSSRAAPVKPWMAAAQSRKPVAPSGNLPPPPALPSLATSPKPSPNEAKSDVVGTSATSKPIPAARPSKLEAATPAENRASVDSATASKRERPKASSGAAKPTPVAIDEPEAENAATLEPVDAGRSPPSVQAPTKVERDRRDEHDEGAAPSVVTSEKSKAASAQKTQSPEPDESAEATAEYRKLDQSASMVRARPKPNRLPIYIGVAAVTVVLLGVAVMKGGDDSSSDTTETTAPASTRDPVAVAERPSPVDPPASNEAAVVQGETEPSQADEVALPDERDVIAPIAADDEPDDEPDAADDEPDAADDEPDAAADDEPDAADDDEPEARGGQATPTTRPPTESASELAAAGRRARAAGKTDEAISLFRRALAKDNKVLSALEGLGLIYFNKGDYKKTVQYTKRAVALSPNNVEYRTLLGDAYFKLARYKDAREHYQRAAARGHAPAKTRLERVEKKLAG